MKTVIQELIEELKANDVAHGMYWIKRPSDFFEKYLEKEKEQIINARDSTASELMKNMEDVWILGKSEYKTRTPEEYYNQTYNQNK